MHKTRCSVTFSVNPIDASLLGNFFSAWSGFAHHVEEQIQLEKEELVIWSLNIAQVGSQGDQLRVLASVELCQRVKVALGMRNLTDSDAHYDLVSLAHKSAIHFLVSQEKTALDSGEQLDLDTAREICKQLKRCRGTT